MIIFSALQNTSLSKYSFEALIIEASFLFWKRSVAQILVVLCNVFYLQSADRCILNRVDQGNMKVVPENLRLHGTSASGFVGDGLPLSNSWSLFFVFTTCF